MGGKNKRSHEYGQLKKEDYEAMESQESKPAGSMDRASGEELKRRRIVRVSDTSKWNSLAGSGSSGAFANVTLKGPTKTPPKSNPFVTASMSPLASQNSEQEKSKITTSDGVADALLQFMISNSHQNSDWDQAMKDYLGYLSALKKELFANSDSTEETAAVQMGKEKTSSSVLSPSNSNSAPSFELSVKPKDDTKAAPKFSFGAPAAGVPAAAPAPFTSFSFTASAFTATPTPPGNAASPAPVTTPAAASVPAESTDKEEWPAPKVQYSDSQVVHQVEVVCYKALDNGRFNSYGKGTLSLEESKSGHAMVMRNAAGKINLNVAISKGMVFIKNQVKGQATVSFVTQEDGKKAMTKLRVHPQNLDELHANLEKLAKKE